MPRENYKFISPLPRDFTPRANEFYKRVEELRAKILKMDRKALLQFIKDNIEDMEVEKYSSHLYLIVDKKEKPLDYYSVVYPSYFLDYRYCARKLLLKIYYRGKYGGDLATIERLKFLVIGKLAHELYGRHYAMGFPEARVASAEYGIIGRTDDLVVGFDRAMVIEVKTGNPDRVGAALQVMAYMVATSESLEIPITEGKATHIRGILLTPRRTYEVFFVKPMFDEYIRRVKLILQLARRLAENEESNELPPRLSGEYSDGKCDRCPYRGLCMKLPDKYRSYDAFFEKYGIRRLMEKPLPARRLQ